MFSSWRLWWRSQSPHRQDRYAVLAPLAAVLLFLAAIVSAFAYLRLEEMEREHEAVRHDVEYAQQHLRLRLLERQEQLMRIAKDLANREIDAQEFRLRAGAMVGQFPELQGLTWLDERKRIRSSYGNASLDTGLSAKNSRFGGTTIKSSEGENAYALAKELQLPIYVQSQATPGGRAPLQLYLPLIDNAHFAGVLLAEYSVESLYRYCVPSEIAARYALSLLDAKGAVLAGSSIPKRNPLNPLLPWATAPNEFEVPVPPVGNGLVIRAQAYRSSFGVIGSGLFWLVCALSVMTAWMLIGNWRHTRRRLQAQQALVSETNFRRAMENSMPTGMRTLDLRGRITYVNAAFCQMTGWAESDLVGCTAPFPYWPEEDHQSLADRLGEELSGRTSPGGFQIRVKRRDNSRFDARIYVSPLIDARGVQTGWMTSMTDITEPNRIREQLSASYERFTTVLEALDASVCVTPMGSDELLFTNKMYREWFPEESSALVGLATRAGFQPRLSSEETRDYVDALAGMPLNVLADSDSESTELFVADLDKWLEVRTRYLTWVDGRLAQIVIATDITPRRLAQEQAALQAQRAETASRLITMGEMASSVAHELNQPLTAINNYCNGMVSRIKAQQISQADLLGALDKTAHQAQRAGQIIQRIRAFVKRSAPNWSLTEVAEMVEEAAELAEIELRRSNVSVQCELEGELPPLLVDPILIEQVLVNLLKNAAESIVQAKRPMDDRRVELHVARAVKEAKNVIEFTVRDNGMGIEPQVMERLYEAFYTTKADGMGIGLSLCRSIVESHHGRMRAENLYNGDMVSGCCFTFWIPLVESPAETPTHALQPDTISG